MATSCPRIRAVMEEEDPLSIFYNSTGEAVTADASTDFKKPTDLYKILDPIMELPSPVPSPDDHKRSVDWGMGGSSLSPIDTSVVFESADSSQQHQDDEDNQEASHSPVGSMASFPSISDISLPSWLAGSSSDYNVMEREQAPNGEMSM